jgi:hypothetical protein
MRRTNMHLLLNALSVSQIRETIQIESVSYFLPTNMSTMKRTARNIAKRFDVWYTLPAIRFGMAGHKLSTFTNFF